MELMKNLRWICRVCAVNVRRKRSPTTLVPIFGAAPLNAKLRKHLDIKVDHNDPLPKSICSTCYKKLEAVHNFALLAKKTESFLRKFITFAQNTDNPAEFNNRFQSEFATFALLASEKESLTAPEQQNRLNVNNSTHILHPDRRINAPTSHPVQSSASNKSPRTYMFSSNSSKNNLEQKRRNLKALLTSNNAQSSAQLSGNNSNNLRFPSSINSPAVQMVSIPTANTIQQQFHKDSFIYDDRLNLGRVIRDMDLLKLILKALKWPVTNENLLLQIQRLKDTPFRNVIIDQNLLQDTDLMQILNTYLSPILLQHQSTPPPILPNLVSYKIPADLSVHLITEEVEEQPARPPVAKKPRRRYVRSKPKVIENSTPIEIPSDDSVQMFEVSIDPNLYFNRESSETTTPENSNSSVAQRKGKELAKIRRKQKRKEAHVQIRSEKTIREEFISKTQSSIVQKKENKTEQIPDSNQVAPINSNKQTNVSTGSENFSIVSKLTETVNPEEQIIVTIIDDASGDDTVWADFKVAESPDNSFSEKILPTATSPIIKTEPGSVKEEQPSLDSIPSEDIVNKEETSEIDVIDIKMETVEVQMDETAIDDEPKLEEIPIDPIEVFKPEEKESLRKSSRKRKAESSVLQANATLPKCSDDNQSTKPMKGKTVTTDSPSTAQRKSGRNIAAAKSTINRKSTRSVSTTPPVMSLRNSNLRRRICKQCGLSFTKLNDFLDHRKMHIQS